MIHYLFKKLLLIVIFLKFEDANSCLRFTLKN